MQQKTPNKIDRFDLPLQKMFLVSGLSHLLSANDLSELEECVQLDLRSSVACRHVDGLFLQLEN